MPRTLLLFAVVAAAIIAQSPALGHFFRADDFLHLYQIEDLGYWRFILKPHGGHVIPTTFSAFYLSRVIFGLYANGYLALAVVSHAFNVYLLFRIVETSTRRSDLAFAAALVWGTSSLNQGSIGWYSVYGHVLACTFALVFLCSVARVASGDRDLTRATLWLWMGCMLGAATSFGVGIPVAMLSGTALYLLLPDTPSRAPAVRALCTLLVLVPVIFLAVHWTHHTLYVAGATDPALGKTLVQQIVSEVPTMFREIASMFAMLLAYGSASLVFGPLIPLSRLSLAGTPWLAYGFSAAMLLALGVSIWRSERTTRRRAFAYLLLAAGCYGIIALGRASFYGSNAYPVMKAATTARYHYLAPAFLAVLLSFLAAEVYRPARKPVLWVGTLAAMLLLGANYMASRTVNGTLPRDAGKYFASTIDSLESKIYAMPVGSTVELENGPFGDPWTRELVPGVAAVFLIQFPENEVDGRRIRFIEHDSERLAYWMHFGGERLRDLLIAPHPGEGHRDGDGRDVDGGHPAKRLD